MDKKNLTLWHDATLATLSSANDYGVIENGAVVTETDRIVWVGHAAQIPRNFSSEISARIGCEGRLLTPGLIDCHTHFVFAGNRANEFEMRLNGKTYAEIARAGGGILSTVKATRSKSFESLYQLSLKRAKQHLRQGITTLEIKSGYGLDLETEKKCLQIAAKLADDLPITIQKTYLGAHALPPEFSDKTSYVNYICETVIPELVKCNLIDAIDGFCETIGFNTEELERIFNVARHYQIPIKLHSEQLSAMGGSQLATKYQALSCDHLEFATEECVAALAKANTVAVLLPGAFYFLKEKQLPPIALLRQANVPIAIATDFNPGSCPSQSILLMANMACVFFKLTPLEALLGITHHAARALGIANDYGSLIVGKKADFALWDVKHPRDLIYPIAHNPCVAIVKEGNYYDFTETP